MHSQRLARCCLMAALLAIGCAEASAIQREPVTRPVDPQLEKFAQHNLKVADYYYSKKKAYAGAKDRLLEIVEVYPEFTRIDRVYFILAECFLRTGEPAKAREFFERLLAERPESEFAEEARSRLGKMP